MTLKVNMTNGGSSSVDYVNDAGTTLAQVKGYDDGSSNGHVEIYTTASGVSSEKVRIDKDGNVGIGTSSPSALLHVYGGNAKIEKASPLLELTDTTGGGNNYGIRSSGGKFLIRDTTSAVDRVAIDSSGNLLVGTTAQPSSSNSGFKLSKAANGTYIDNATSLSTSWDHISFINPNGTVGYIRTSSSTTTYSTSSDYRLKENIAPMTGALSVVQALKPCTYTWKADGSDGQGFIAHELQEVVPDCVTGEKDAVDADGNPIYQGIDTSFLVATLTAAIQEQQALITQQAAALTTLTERIAALENK